MPPTLGHGKICYLMLPALDVEHSAAFYERALAWRVRRREDGSVAFDDAVGEVSGRWVTGRSAAADPGMLVYVMVADAQAASEAVIAAGGTIEQPVDPHASERFAHFRDPAGNLLGLYQQPGLAADGPDVSPVPAHVGTVTPRITVGDGAGAIDFYTRAFDAVQVGERYFLPDGTLVHAEVRIGNSIVFVSEGEGGFCMLLATYWHDVDAAWDRAVAAGAEILYPLADHDYGERGGRLRDPYGHEWMVAARIAPPQS
ncbi:MAG TPA: VOC family protein [Solirubrobacteraceae bacterium]|jgi:hypothetical protein|nr:VOC family protein [Solirubrobacteraceae bacterium]